MAYWLTTHWPPRKDAPEDIASGVWLSDGREHVGKDLRAGDLVLVYQARTGRTKIVRELSGVERRVPCLVGREGVVAIAEAVAPFADDSESEPENYVDGSRIWWRWHAPLKVLSRSGYVPRRRVNEILGYKTAYNYRGFGPAHSGLGPITVEQFEALAAEFRRGDPITLPILPVPPKFRGGPEGTGIESEAHLALKEYLAANPSSLLSEAGLLTEGVEYPFPTGDRADVVLSDRLGRIIGAEIEVAVGDGDWEGPLQAIKYRHMLEPLTGRQRGDSRAILVAYDISDTMLQRCADYAVECFIIDRPTVERWRAGEA